MKRFGIFAVTALSVGLFGATQAVAGPINLVVNGNFGDNNLNGGWGLFSNGQVTGWTTTDPGGLIELDTAGPIGPGTNPFSTNSLEVNANNPETVQQTVTGLVVGNYYELTYEYGDRPGSGPESMNVAINAQILGNDTDAGGNSSLVWVGNTFYFQATGTSEVLSFIGLPDSGGASYGNEITDVAITATPEPATWLLMLSGLGLLGFAVTRKRSVPVSLPIASI